MPTIDRKTRRRACPAIPALSLPKLVEQARTATPKAWEGGLRRALVRALVKGGHRTEIAEGIARAYELRPGLIPMRAPPGIK